MAAQDLPSLLAIADVVHPRYPEDSAVFAERLRLYPQGCLVLERSEEPVGYIVSHPWTFGRPPALNTMLERLPADPTTFYIHDIALLPTSRRSGAAPDVVRRLTAHARSRGIANLSLVAVNDSVAFWRRLGFRQIEDPSLSGKLASYDAEARFMVCQIAESGG